MDARRFLKVFLIVALLGAGLLAAALWIVDPYDRGHGWFRKAGTVERGPRTAHVSRARNPDFNAAIIGNSHLQLLKPSRLSARTGLSFVQLTVPATSPREQFAMLDWFHVNHSGNFRALVLGVDFYWCTADPKLPNYQPFPFWLYDTGDWTYAHGLFRLKAVQLAPRRIAMLAGRGKPQAADGFWDYEALRVRDETYFRKDIATVRAPGFWNETGKFPAIDRLGAELGKLPAGLPVVLIAPPIFIDGLPEAGSAQALGERACVAALQRIASGRANTTLIDARKDTPLVRDPLNFWDATHYGGKIAEVLESAAAAAISGK